MPNGGSDNCGNCSYNTAVQEIGSLTQLITSEDLNADVNRFQRASYCALRNVSISNVLWTYCDNFCGDGYKPKNDVAIRWIFASGLYEGYARIPWDDLNEPRINVQAVCTICGNNTAAGISLERDGQLLGFCSNRHYIEWWKTIHRDDLIKPEQFKEPEHYHEELPNSLLKHLRKP